ncbi:MAG: SpoIIE family protein phosphatase [Bacteroidales bacterium]|nr:SpoIIE family protein phosphatase [Bacteroidales bacterium]
MIRNAGISAALFCIFMVQLLLPYQAEAQTYSYRTYDVNTGLPGSYLNVIEQDGGGLLWVGLETGLYRYDGFDFHPVVLPDTLSTGYPNALFCDAGGTMWVGLTDGSLFTADPGGFPERVTGLEADRINRITEGPDGRIWIITQTRGIYRSDAGGEKITRLSLPEELILFDISFAGRDTVLAATQDNLHLIAVSGNDAVISHTFPELEYTWVQTVKQMDLNTWFAGTDGAGLYMIRRADGVMRAESVTDTTFMNLRIPDLVASGDRSLLVATREAGVLRTVFSEDYSSWITEPAYDIASGLADNDIRTVFRDRENNLWIGLFNKGLAAVTTNAFSFHFPAAHKEINFIGMSGGKRVMGTRNGLYDYNPETGEFENFRPLTARTGGTGIASWAADEAGNILIGTAGSGLWLMEPDGALRQLYRSGNPAQNRINSIAPDGDNIWLATMNGVVLLDRESGEQKAHYTTWEMLPHNNVSQVVANRPGEVLVATETDRLCYIHITGGVRTEGLVMDGPMRNRINSINVAPDGTICAGTLGNGLFLFTADTVYNFSTADGMLSNYSYSTLIASDGRIWTGHEKGFSIINPASGSIRTFSTEFGVVGDCLSNAMAETPDSNIYVGTTEGVVEYRASLDEMSTAQPQAVIVSVVINNTEYPLRESYSLPYRSSYTIGIKYAGISLRDPLNVIYRSRLENFDEGWGEVTTDRSVTYRLSDGHYRFAVEAFTRDAPDNASAASFSLLIQKPFTERWWFILSVLALVAAAAWVVIRLRERAHRKQREFLESELRKRTAEVYQQKEELAQKNLDITESITYAKRIQSSVLPDTNRLATVFNDAFVFFLPRDIVSGDFFWFDWIDKDRFMVVCSDSTGHGVPGAFMSMIGTALLQDIITVKKMTRPSQVLHELDRQIFSTLNQNQELEASNDGMDIVVCEFNIRTRHLVFASAMRPVILVIDGEQHYVRGNRSSVGGESYSEKFFDDQEYHLREGDIVYLFTDGYCDQFGGEGGKKMKVSRLKMLIDDIRSLPMQEQEKQVREFFYEWQGENEQVDDVLFMGLKV